MQLFGDPFALDFHLVHCALNVAGLPAEIREVEGGVRPTWLLDVSPRGWHPVLVANDVAIDDPVAAVEYVAEGSAALFAGNAADRAVQRRWLNRGRVELAERFERWLFARNETEQQRIFGDMVDSLRALDKALALEQALGRGPWLNSGTLSVADLALAPVIARCVALREDGLFLFPARMPNLLAWSHALAAEPCVAETFPADWARRLRSASAAHGGTALLSRLG